MYDDLFAYKVQLKVFLNYECVRELIMCICQHAADGLYQKVTHSQLATASTYIRCLTAPAATYPVML